MGGREEVGEQRENKRGGETEGQTGDVEDVCLWMSCG